MAKDFLTEHNVAFTDYDVAQDVEKRQEMIQRSGQMGVPVIIVDTEVIIGFDQERLAHELGLQA